MDQNGTPATVAGNAEYQLYQRIRLIGEGAFGQAYLVQCLQDGSKWVIKQMEMNAMSEAQKNETFKQFKILKALQHPNIVQFRQVYKTKKGKLCIVMEYADGGDLAKQVKDQKGKLFDESTILDWFTQICLAIQHVHDRQIIHRDLKGQNIFLNSKNIVKLGDFGIARILSQTAEKAQTMVGTPYYLSPEIIESQPYSNKTDIWSLGVILYELCSLKPPFNADSLHFLALKIVRGAYNPMPNQYSKELQNLVAAMLNVDPVKRPSIHEILKMPVITNRIKNFLTETVRGTEFSHTILHNKNFVNPKVNMNQIQSVNNEAPCPQHLLPKKESPVSPVPPPPNNNYNAPPSTQPQNPINQPPILYNLPPNPVINNPGNNRLPQSNGPIKPSGNVVVPSNLIPRPPTVGGYPERNQVQRPNFHYNNNNLNNPNNRNSDVPQSYQPPVANIPQPPPPENIVPNNNIYNNKIEYQQPPQLPPSQAPQRFSTPQKEAISKPSQPVQIIQNNNIYNANNNNNMPPIYAPPIKRPSVYEDLGGGGGGAIFANPMANNSNRKVNSSKNSNNSGVNQIAPAPQRPSSEQKVRAAQYIKQEEQKLRRKREEELKKQRELREKQKLKEAQEKEKQDNRQKQEEREKDRERDDKMMKIEQDRKKMREDIAKKRRNLSNRDNGVVIEPIFGNKKDEYEKASENIIETREQYSPQIERQKWQMAPTSEPLIKAQKLLQKDNYEENERKIKQKQIQQKSENLIAQNERKKWQIAPSAQQTPALPVPLKRSNLYEQKNSSESINQSDSTQPTQNDEEEILNEANELKQFLEKEDQFENQEIYQNDEDDNEDHQDEEDVISELQKILANLNQKVKDMPEDNQNYFDLETKYMTKPLINNNNNKKQPQKQQSPGIGSKNSPVISQKVSSMKKVNQILNSSSDEAPENGDNDSDNDLRDDYPDDNEQDRQFKNGESKLVQRREEKIKPFNAEEEKCISYIQSGYSQLESLRELLEDKLGFEVFFKAHKILKELIEQNNGITYLEQYYEQDQYRSLLPFIQDEQINIYMPIFNIVIFLEDQLENEN